MSEILKGTLISLDGMMKYATPDEIKDMNISIEPEDKFLLNRILSLREAMISYTEISDILKVPYHKVMAVAKKYTLHGDKENPLTFFHYKENRIFTKRVYWLLRVRKMSMQEIVDELGTTEEKVRYSIITIVTQEMYLKNRLKYRVLLPNWVDYIAKQVPST